MTKKNESSTTQTPKSHNPGEYLKPLFRDEFALVVLIGSFAIIVALAVVVIVKSSDNTLTVFNILLPVLATWVGTVLAFYFGKQNFESANQQVQKIFNRLAPEPDTEELVTSIMRPYSDMKFYRIPEGKTEADVTMQELKDNCENNKVTRLPIIDNAGKPKYMIHESLINKYLSEDAKNADKTLEAFVKENDCTADKGFVLAAEDTSIAEAKAKMEACKCQDIFITKGGTADEPLLGWISNVRLVKELKA